MRRAVGLVGAAFALSTLWAGALGGCGNDDSIFPQGQGGNTVAEQIDPAPGGIRRLLARQYVNSVEMIFGEAAAAAADPPDDSSLHGFATIGNANVALDAASVERYETSAMQVADAVIGDASSFQSVVPCTPSGPSDQACYEAFIRDAGRLAWRRDLDDDEVGSLRDVAMAAGSEYGAFELGIRYAIMGLLTAPDFLYVVEVGEPDGNDPGKRWLTQTELVTRMSLFLTDTTPDAAMLDAALTGDLETDEAIRALATELLQRPRAREVTRAFFDELYGLGKLETLSKDEVVFTDWSSDVALAMRESMQLMLEDIVWERDADMREMLTADYAFVNETLAPVYDMSVTGQTMEKMSLPSEQDRVGILGQAGYLAIQSKTTRESAVKRGLFIRHKLMCDEIPPPPPDVTPELPEVDPDQPMTMKERLELHQEDPSCATCHARTDPPAYPLQHFDGIGKYREDEDGLPIDPSGESPGLGSWSDIYEMTQLLYDNPAVPACFLRNFYRHAIGHLEEEGEVPAIHAMNQAFEEGGFSVQKLLVEIVASPAFQMVGEPK